MKKKKDKTIWLFIIPLCILTCISLFLMDYFKNFSDIYNLHLKKQLLWILISLAGFLMIRKIPFKWISKLALPSYVICLFLLILVLFIGKETHGARCWLSLGPISIQPSELMKIPLILLYAKLSSKYKRVTLKKEIEYVLILFLLFLIPSIFVFLEPDTGAIIIYFLLFLTTFFSSKLHKLWYIISTIIILIILISFFLSYLFIPDILIKYLGTSIFYRMDRILDFQNKEGLQIERALTTVGSASFLGNGLEKMYLYIPEAPTDFVFASLSGSFGILGLIIVLLCYLMLFFFFLIKSNTTRKKEEKKIILLFLSIFVFQSLYNIYMNIGLLPIMGISLPLLSYGGTTMLIHFLLMGIILHTKKEYK